MTRRALLSRVGLTVLVFGAVWVAIILHWRASNRVPNGTDVALYLVALPVVLLLGVWVIYRSVLFVKQKRSAPTADAKPDAADVPATPADDPSLAWQLPFVAVAAKLPAGDSLAALVDAGRAEQRVELHASLKDSHDNPAFAAEAEGVDIAPLEASLPATARNWSVARKRALVLAAQLAASLLEEHFEALRIPRDPNAPLTRVKPRVLQLEWLLPAAWSDADRELARGWLASELATKGWDAPELQITATAATGGPAVLKRLDDLNRAYNQPTLALPHLLLASDSYLDAATLADWEAARHLHTADHKEGRVPGEGASAILIAPATHPATKMPVQLGRLFAAQRAKAVDQPQRLQADTLKALAEQAQTHARWTGEGDLQLVADAGMRPSRSAEAVYLTEVLAPEQDPSQSLLLLGVANGDSGAALTLAVVAVAAHLCASDQHACLVFSNQDPVLRAAMQVTPAAPASADTAESTT